MRSMCVMVDCFEGGARLLPTLQFQSAMVSTLAVLETGGEFGERGELAERTGAERRASRAARLGVGCAAPTPCAGREAPPRRAGLAAPQRPRSGCASGRGALWGERWWAAAGREEWTAAGGRAVCGLRWPRAPPACPCVRPAAPRVPPGFPSHPLTAPRAPPAFPLPLARRPPSLPTPCPAG
uniref:Uncharacterized protein n=1 Tax=Arundo donax TaxID=35708 RepID=A0A0A8ZRG3_ARUDO